MSTLTNPAYKHISNHEFAEMRPAIDETADDSIARDDEVLHGRGQVRQRRKEAGPKLPVGLPAVVDEKVVIAVFAGHEGIHEVRVVRVEHLHEGLGEALCGVVHVVTPLVRCVGASNANPMEPGCQ